MANERPATVGRFFDYAVSRRGNAVFVYFKGCDYHYDEIKERVDLIAKSFLASGVRHGDHVAVWLGNSVEWICLELALHAIGAVLVGPNTRYHERELAHALKQSDAKALVFQNRFLQEGFADRLQSLIPELGNAREGELGSAEFPNLRLMIDIDDRVLPGSLNYNSFLERGKDIPDKKLRQAKEAVNENDPALLVYTSGTTGEPKGALLGQRAIYERMNAIADWMHLTEDDITFFGMPMYHTFGCVYALYLTLVSMGKLCLQEKFKSHEALEMISGQHCTNIMGVPSAFQMMINEPDFTDFDLSSGRTGVIGGAPSSETLLAIVRDKFAPELCSGFGLTESIAGICMTHIGDPARLLLETLGTPLEGNEIAIKDPQTGERVPNHIAGEICIRSAYNMLGYYKMPEATAKAIDAEGYLHSGDLGYMDDNNYLHLTGRLKDTIIAGGVNIDPLEIENYLESLPGVMSAQVVGKKDERMGEVPVACIVRLRNSQITAETIIAHCRDNFANYKVPREVFFMDGFPMTASGKVRKFKLAEQINGSADWLFNKK
jgi:fatty-acyl-CoA synthase